MSSATISPRYRGLGSRGGKTHGICLVCGGPTDRVMHGAGFRRTCSDECRKARGHPKVEERVRRQRQGEGVAEYAEPQPRMAIRRCVCCNRPVPWDAPGQLWADGTGLVHIID